MKNVNVSAILMALLFSCFYLVDLTANTSKATASATVLFFNNEVAFPKSERAKLLDFRKVFDVQCSSQSGAATVFLEILINEEKAIDRILAERRAGVIKDELKALGFLPEMIFSKVSPASIANRQRIELGQPEKNDFKGKVFLNFDCFKK